MSRIETSKLLRINKRVLPSQLTQRQTSSSSLHTAFYAEEARWVIESKYDGQGTQWQRFDTSVK